MIENKDGYLFEWRDVKESKNTDRGLMPRWRNMLDFAGIKEFKGRHALRHTLASMLSDSGASTQELMTLIGWTDQRSVLRYAGTSQEKLVSIMNTLDSQWELNTKKAIKKRQNNVIGVEGTTQEL